MVLDHNASLGGFGVSIHAVPPGMNSSFLCRVWGTLETGIIVLVSCLPKISNSVILVYALILK